MPKTTAQAQVRPLAEALQADDTQPVPAVELLADAEPEQTPTEPAVTVEPEPGEPEQDTEQPAAEPEPAPEEPTPAAPEPAEPVAAAPVDPWRAKDRHAAEILLQLLTAAPMVNSARLYTSAGWREPYIALQLHDDRDHGRLMAFQKQYGGRLSHQDRGEQTYSEVAFELDGVPVTAWTLLPPVVAAVGA